MAAGIPVPAAALTRAATAQAMLNTAIATQSTTAGVWRIGDTADQAQGSRQVGGGQAQQQRAERRCRAADGSRVDQHRRQLVVQPRGEEEAEADCNHACHSQQQSGAKQETGGQARRGHDRDEAVSVPGEPG